MFGSSIYNPTFAQPTITCPEYSFCIEIDPVDCDKIKVSLNGLSGQQIAGLSFLIDVSDINIDVPATQNSFQNSSIYQHFLNMGSASLSVNQNLISLQYATNIPGAGYMVNDDCLHLGDIILEMLEFDCLPDAVLANIQINLGFGGGLRLGPDLQNSVLCSQFTMDCPCASECNIDNWFLLFSGFGFTCNSISVTLLDLEASNVSGIRFGFVFDPNLEIDIDQTKNSIQTSPKLGGNNWEVEDLSITNNSISFFYGNESGTGNNVNFDGAPEELFKIYVIPQPGVCYDFGVQGVSYLPQSGIFIGDHLNHPDVVFCDNYISNITQEICSEAVVLKGVIQRPTPGGSCDEGIDFGFPFGEVVVSGTFCGYEYEFIALTDEDGSYELEVFPNTEYIVTPNYTDEHKYACGVNSIDMEIIRAVILGSIPCFDFKFSTVAADMDLNERITTYDIYLIQNYITGHTYPTNGIWRFMPYNQYVNNFLSVVCPDSLLSGYTNFEIVNLSGGDNNNVNFAAIKMGDVDGSCEQCLEPNSLQNPPTNLMLSSHYDTETEELVLRFANDQLEDISIINIAIDGGQDIILQAETTKELLTADSIKIRGTGMMGSTYGWVSLSEEGITLRKNQEIARFPVKELRSSFGVNLNLGEIVADGVLYYLELTSDFVEIVEKSKESNITSTLFSLYPNPGSDQLFINLADADHFIVSIKDMLGRGFGEFYGNDSNIEINTRDLPNGTYVITVKNEEILEFRVWIKK